MCLYIALRDLCGEVFLRSTSAMFLPDKKNDRIRAGT